MVMEYAPVIGLEIHVELKTKTKMFCASLNDPDEKRPNFNICPVCMGYPGTLPVINHEAVRKVLLVGAALGCELAQVSNFDRKNYFYPDIPKGYQISQYARPLCLGGKLKVGGRDLRITRIHLEEDTGRSQHVTEGLQQATEGERSAQGQQAGVHDPSGDFSLVDFNRAGVPLMELVTEPDITSGSEVREFAEKLRLLLRYLDVSDADMEKGQLRVEVNISLRNKEEEKSNKFGTKVEIKNLNSIKAAASAVDYEVKRQSELLDNGDVIHQETRGWDEFKQITFSQRSKESAHDYRYFPEPDLPELRFSAGELEAIKQSLPELPEQKYDRFIAEYKLPAQDVDLLVNDPPLANYFEQVISELGSWDKLSHLTRPAEEPVQNASHIEPGRHFAKLIKLSANYMITELKRRLNEAGLELKANKITAENFAELMVRIFHQEISSSAAQTVLEEMFISGKDPEEIIKEKNLGQMSDSADLQAIAETVIADNPKAVEDFKGGKTEAAKFLVGKIMMATKGKANPSVAQSLLEKLLK